MASNPLLSSPALLDKIDRLFGYNVGKSVEPVQLIVVGDQGSGKSSVLEGLTRFPFPHDSTLCTRFATQIVFRRTHQAHATMGVRTTVNQAKPTFSRHVFYLEITGPEEDHISVLDLPGIFRPTEPGGPTKHDSEMVLSLVLDYMKQCRSIILAVVPANVDIVTQKIILRVKEVDPTGRRTLGVLTKPDLVECGQEKQVLDLLMGESLPLQHGWVLVRNLGKSEITSNEESRSDLEEKIIRHDCWKQTPREKFGYESLRRRVQEIVVEHTRRHFPEVRSEINKKLSVAKLALAGLGEERNNLKAQADFLLDIVSKFQDVRAKALSGNYASSDIFDKAKLARLATAVLTRNEQFQRDMIQFGHVYAFQPNETDFSGQYHLTHHSDAANIQHKTRLVTRKIDTALDVSDILDEYNGLRAFELGTLNTYLVPLAMKKQSSSDIIAVVSMFMVDILEDLCPNSRVSHGLMAIITDELHSQYQKAIDHTRFLVDNERSDTLMTLHQSFTDNAYLRPELKLQKFISEKTFDYRNSPLGKVVRVNNMMTVLPQMSSTEYTVRQIHDILQLYYIVARARFIDNICIQCTNYLLLNGPSKPMKLLSASLVFRLSEEQLQDIAGEDSVSQRKRQQLKQEIEDLEAARRILL
ncbi:P-loop containing nucleoside triphosphate hydrolase protein [Aspergillus pseudoustus]|uniref:P-loop containing nucleoside triphosphate hydrolase protein n=1 Tax=Aspergillus pseudoustus TaxID=1810923 RepID=A0ABR4INP2_9EURO